MIIDTTGGYGELTINTEDNTPTFTAIQCKFYDKYAKVPKSGIDSFVNASDKKYFTQRFIVATNEDWTDNVRKNLADKSVPIKIITRTELEESSIDWSVYLESNQTQIQSLHRELRPYQVEALNNVISGFKTHDRGKLIMACGTGKTFTSLKIAERQTGPHGFVLFLVPSLSLLSQTLSDWKRYSTYPISAFAVCSDSKVGSAAEDLEDLLASSELTYPATTNPESLARAVNRIKQLTDNEDLMDINAASTDASKHALGMTVVFSTYHSIDGVATAQHTFGMPEFDLVICDEAHRTTGCFEQTGVVINRPLVNQLEAKSLAQDSQNAANNADVEPVITVSEDQEQNSNDVASVSQDKSDKSQKSSDKANKRKRNKSSIGIVNESASAFSFVHNNEYLRAKKRLYMTATPKIYVNRQGVNTDELDVYSMDDEAIYGKLFHFLNFSDAVRLGCLVDYKVLILVMDSKFIPHSDILTAISQNNCAKIIGTWKALNKYGSHGDLIDDCGAMKRAVGFAQIIDSKKPDKVASKKFTEYFQSVVNEYKDRVEKEVASGAASDKLKEEYEFMQQHPLTCACEHIDGHMDAVQKSAKLDWLKAEPVQNETKILFNVRCLSEGVDVPSLDAVIFFSPRSSPVEVVQTVGRVMRKAPGKETGYVIVPLIVKNPDDPEEAFKASNYTVVWQILNALKSINPHSDLFDARLDKLDPRIQIRCYRDITAPVSPLSKDKFGKDGGKRGKGGKGGNNGGNGGSGGSDDDNFDPNAHMSWLFTDEQIQKYEKALSSAIVKKLGDRKSWEKWAEDVAEICTKQVEAIETHLQEHPESHQAFNDFKQELSSAVRVKLSDDEVIDMLSQHIVVKPVLDELFRGFPFAEKNPIAHALTQILELLDKDGLNAANEQLKDFYSSVALRMNNVQTLRDRQIVIVDLFDNFFKKAFPKQQEKLGIVYTPVEIVDFINHSVNDLLQKEFGCSLSSKDVHILDPFTGTGTFITRMMLDQDLIKPEDLERKYQHELHAYEIMPLAYYVASINMEAAYAELTHQSPGEYERNNIVVLTDTFADKRDINFDEDRISLVDSELDHNNELREQVESHPLRVIIGNPPYSVGQSSQNDDNKNSSYPILEDRLAATYVKKSGKVSNKSKLYDSYIKAFRWASDQLGEQGVIAFVSNAGWLDSTSACGMRRCFQEEFSSVYIYHLKGNQRTSGEQSRREGGKIFGAGSRAPIAITVLVKNPQAQEQGKIYFAAVDDYLSREEKLNQVKSLGSMVNVEFTEINQDEYGDWLNHRCNDFAKFISLDGKNNDGLAVFSNFSIGVNTSRDAWVYNASRQTIADNFTKCISFYNFQVDEATRLGDQFIPDSDKTKIAWGGLNYVDSKTGKKSGSVFNGLYSDQFRADLVWYSIFRPFFKEFLYNDKFWIHRNGQMPKLYPYHGVHNLSIITSGKSAKDFSVLMTNQISCFDCLEKSQCFPRYVYRKADEKQDSTKGSKYGKGANASKAGIGGLLSEIEDSEHESRVATPEVDAHGYIREDAIKPEAVEYFRQAYPEAASKIDAGSVFYYIYGILHSPEYRSTYANNMQKELPRIPRMATYAEFSAFEQAGRALAKLHVDYEQVPMYEGCQIEFASNANYLVEQLKYGKIEGKKGNDANDKTTIFYNSGITIRNIPLEAQEYVVNKKSALDWIVERCCVSQDKDSKIVNNYNDYAKEIGDEKYIFNLILRVITVSLETMKIVKSLPPLNIHPLDK